MEVFVEGLAFEGYHGVYEEERRDGRHFEVDVRAEVADEGSAESDELEDTLDYRHLAKAVEEVAHGPSRFLVEKMAGAIAEKILDEHRSVASVTVRVRKKAPDVIGEPRWVGVELIRRRAKNGTDE